MMQEIQGEPSWRLAAGRVELYVTRQGGQMAPVRFDLGNGMIASPYSLAPWLPVECPRDTPPLLKALRGDFFCLPFGVSALTPHPHGATANLEWQMMEERYGELQLGMVDAVTGAEIEKRLEVRGNHRAVYQRHGIRNLEGRFNFGHHPILEFPEPAGACQIRTGPLRFGQVYPGTFEDPANGGYSCLGAGERFNSLDAVPLAAGGTTSLAKYPDREGFEDLVMFSQTDPEFGWIAVHFPGYVWMALKNTRELPSTLLWHSNGGRHYAPWNGKHRRRLGVEDVCSYFHEGVETSSRDLLRKEGISTSHRFKRDETMVVHHIQMVHPLEDSFGTIERVERREDGKGLQLLNADGKSKEAAVDWDFLFED